MPVNDGAPSIYDQILKPIVPQPLELHNAPVQATVANNPAPANVQTIQSEYVTVKKPFSLCGLFKCFTSEPKKLTLRQKIHKRNKFLFVHFIMLILFLIAVALMLVFTLVG